MSYHIRPIETPAEHADFEALQGEVWGDGNGAPSPVAIAIAHHGGVVLGAFEDGSNRLLGGVLSFIGLTDRPAAKRGLVQHSHLACVRNELHGQGIGEALKRAQAEATRAQGLNLISWTYDPILARNAWLNIGKLGCVCSIFIENLYGVMTDQLNHGLPSDRFEAEWWLDDARPVPDPASPLVEVEIPSDFQAIKQQDMARALALRLSLRERCEALFADGFVVFGFNPDRARPRYRLQRALLR